MRGRPSTAARAGFTLVELVVSACIFSLIVAGFVMSTKASGDTSAAQGLAFDLEAEAFALQRSLRRELRRSGYATRDGEAFPQTHPIGEAPGFEHDGSAAAPLARESIFLAPSDSDGDEWPDLDAQGRVLWEDAVRALLLRPIDADFHELVLAQWEGTERVLSRRALDLRVTTTEEAGFAIPLRALRLEVTLGRRDRSGRILRRGFETTVTLHNGGLGG